MAIVISENDHVVDVKARFLSKTSIDCSGLECWIVNEKGENVELTTQISTLVGNNHGTSAHPLILHTDRLSSCEERMLTTIEDLKTCFETRPLMQLPNYDKLKKKYIECRREKSARYNCIIIYGPKGCGKTTGLFQLYEYLKAEHVNVLFVDWMIFLNEMDPKLLSDFIKERKPDVLLIDNVQAFKYSADIFKIPFIVAAVSPCGKESTGVQSFRQIRRKKDTTITFSPLSLTHAKKFLECHGVKVKEQGYNICSSERENGPAESDNEIYYLEKFEKNKGMLRTGGGRGSSSGSEQANVTGAEGESSLDSEQTEVPGSERESLLGLEQTEVSGAEASDSVQTGSISFAGNLKELAGDEFMKLFYQTGGIPRYLYNYVVDLNHDAMTEELDKQMMEVYEHEGRENVVSSVLQVALNQEASSLHPTVRWGIAYKDEHTNYYHIVSPYYISIVAQKNLVIQRDWKKLEQLTVFMLRHVSYCMSNSKAKSTPVRIQTATKDFICQRVIGEVTLSPEKITIISLADGHPVIDALVVDPGTKMLYFVQTSFSKYSTHKKKMEDLFSTPIEKGGKNVFYHYKNIFKNYKSVFVYATPQEDHSNNAFVYFLDLRCVSAFKWE